MSALVLSALLTLSPLSLADELSLDQAVRQAESRYGGQVLDIQSIGRGDDKAFRIKLLQPSGRVKLLVIEARDGMSRSFRSDDDDDDDDSGKGRGRGRGRGGD